ncbi:alpha,alpha-trehalose-phosphate synthase (UDP-forming) [Fonsecaea pedrosoi CBS 271.37]|uniref:Unplaced genomic scaffold supercont1.8, whole genome shotgun sequence n=1 Tax=Fonsecaea pedrosoi CBS 271.37 TaxID=1442368 RepID=A0A0D2DAP2_9EURO|nr:alpha,alpha-trehalose-phosphate synthase (UDP-forming) [Fonsecaea pedrosoi CBS 271.37]KIW74671.1 alpha,alpha-trehalose-phosphate synthase (UDP-forming) [Fonsecaea pedrosoi CBS 271.37]
MDPDFEGRVLVVANRVPISIKTTQEGEFEYSMSSGGLVSGLKGLAKAIDFKWFGWPGIDVHRNDKDRVRRHLQDKFNAVPIFLAESLAEMHYNGFSNSILWPLLHRMPDRAGSDERWSKAYQEVNEIFADNIVPYVEDNDIIWVHDYHLLLLPGILRERLSKKKNLKIGFFLHTPFPTEDYFTILPFREQICKSLLLCDVVGFHTNQYAKDFLESARIVLEGVARSPSDLHWNGRKVIVHGFPLGIEADEWKQKLQTDAVKQEAANLRAEFDEQIIILGVDRLDYIKGIPQKLRAFDRFLTDHPEWVGKVVMVQLAIPSREDVDTYRKLREEVESLVGCINGKHATFKHTPIHYLHRSVKPEQLCALYAISDVLIVSSIRDGLNLVSYEYAACQEERKGVLMMSTYAGAIKTLPPSSLILLNPWDTPRFAERINQAVNMGMDERAQRHKEMMQVVDTWTSVKWGKAFLHTMMTMEVPQDAEMPDRDPLVGWTSEVPDSETGTIRP